MGRAGLRPRLAHDAVRVRDQHHHVRNQRLQVDRDAGGRGRGVGLSAYRRDLASRSISRSSHARPVLPRQSLDFVRCRRSATSRRDGVVSWPSNSTQEPTSRDPSNRESRSPRTRLAAERERRWIDPLSPIDLHFRVLALLRETPSRRPGNLIARGVAWHDGEQVELRGEADNQPICVLPEDLVDRAMPVTGAYCDWYPGVDFYIVCGDCNIMGLGGRSNSPQKPASRDQPNRES